MLLLLIFAKYSWFINLIDFHVSYKGRRLCFSIKNNIFNLTRCKCAPNIHTAQDVETKVHDQAGPRTADTHSVSRCEWRSNLRTVLSLLDEHDERHRPSIQGIDVRPLATSACHSRRASYTERNGPIYSEGYRFWLLSADVTDPPPSPRDTNLSMYPHEEARWSAPSLSLSHLSFSFSLYKLRHNMSLARMSIGQQSLSRRSIIVCSLVLCLSIRLNTAFTARSKNLNIQYKRYTGIKIIRRFRNASHKPKLALCLSIIQFSPVYIPLRDCVKHYLMSLNTAASGHAYGSLRGTVGKQTTRRGHLPLFGLLWRATISSLITRRCHTPSTSSDRRLSYESPA